jgi:small nuclear ribonucleoprotein (snRNP)-like protein
MNDELENVIVGLSNNETVKGKVNLLKFDKNINSVKGWIEVYDAVIENVNSNDLIINKSHIIYIMLNK